MATPPTPSTYTLQLRNAAPDCTDPLLLYNELYNLTKDKFWIFASSQLLNGDQNVEEFIFEQVSIGNTILPYMGINSIFMPIFGSD